MKKSKIMRYDGEKCCWGDGELPPSTMLRAIFEYGLGATYPKHILERRINLLTDRELKVFTTHWAKIVERIEKNG